jgi:succinate-semialdehyde dehydrogenase/glutarate-semialdehyde dehydrogenase
MQPTLLTNLKRGVPTLRKNYPVASYKVENEQEAIDLANDSPFALGGSIFTKDIKRAMQVADQIDSGMIFINEPTTTQPDLPLEELKVQVMVVNCLN